MNERTRVLTCPCGHAHPGGVGAGWCPCEDCFLLWVAPPRDLLAPEHRQRLDELKGETCCGLPRNGGGFCTYRQYAADLVRQIEEQHAEIERLRQDRCTHPSSSGIDQTWGPDKVWACDNCGWLHRVRTRADGISEDVAVIPDTDDGEPS